MMVFLHYNVFVFAEQGKPKEQSLSVRRYWYDALKRKRYTTAEIIVDESEWDPLPSEVARREKVAVRIGVAETRLREKVKMAGGRWWGPARRVWMLPMEQVLQLGLSERVDAMGLQSRAGQTL